MNKIGVSFLAVNSTAASLLFQCFTIMLMDFLLNQDASLLQGIPYVIYWKSAISYYAACHFRHALFSVVQRYFIPCEVGAYNSSYFVRSMVFITINKMFVLLKSGMPYRNSIGWGGSDYLCYVLGSSLTKISF